MFSQKSYILFDLRGQSQVYLGLVYEGFPIEKQD